MGFCDVLRLQQAVRIISPGKKTRYLCVSKRVANCHLFDPSLPKSHGDLGRARMAIESFELSTGAIAPGWRQVWFSLQLAVRNIKDSKLYQYVVTKMKLSAGILQDAVAITYHHGAVQKVT